MVMFIAIFFAPSLSDAGCSTKDLHDLKAASFTQEEIDAICPICSPSEIIWYSEKDIPKKEISQICSNRKIHESNIATKNKSEIMPWYVLLVTKPMAIGFDAYHTDKVLKNQEDDGNFKIDKKGADIFNIYLKYTLPISSLTYAFDDNRPDKPHPLLKSLKLYVEGNYGNSINSNGSGSGLTVKTSNESYYKAGIRFEADIETLLSRGENYKYFSNY